MKNCDPFVSCPLFAIDTVPLALCCQGIKKIRFSLEICLEKGKQCEIRGKTPQKTEEIEKKILRFSWDLG